MKDCSVYCYSPEEDPYDGDEGTIWSINYFFFNKTRKRVCYIYLRGLSIISHSPIDKAPASTKRGADNDILWPEGSGARKRAKYWLGDQVEDVTSASDEEDEEDGYIAPFAQEYDISELLVGADAYRHLASASPCRGRSRSKSVMRGVSEDIAESMEM